MTNAEDHLSSWTIYDRPVEYPDGYLARRFMVMSGRVIATADTITGPLDELRAHFLAKGLICFRRAPTDNVSTVETWM